MKSLLLCLLLVVWCLGQEEEEKEDPFDGKYALARKAWVDGDIATAQDLLEELLPDHGETVASLYADLAVAYTHNNRLDDAYNTYLDGLDLHSTNGMLQRGFCHFGARVYETASQPQSLVFEDVIDACISGINTSPRDFMTHSVISKLLYKQGSYQEALTFLENGIKYAEKTYRRDKKPKPQSGRQMEEEKQKMNQEVYFDMLHSMAVIHMDHGLPERAVEIGDQLLKLDYQRFALLVGQIRARLVPYDKEAIGLLMNHLSTSVSSCKTTIDCDSELEFVFDWEKLPESSNLKVQQINKETALLPFGPEFSRGEGIEGRYSNFKVYHAEMKDAYLSGNALRQECKLIAGSQKQLLASSNVCVETFSDIAKISSNVPLFSLFPNFGSESYFHWILGGLTRVVMYQSMFSDTFSKGEYQLLLSRLEKGEMNGFVRETLELLLGDNVGEKVVEYPLRDATHISSTFHVIDWVTPQESIYLDNAWSISYPPKELLELTHSRFNEILGNENKEGRIKVLYVEREEKKGNGRYVQEQNEFKGQMREKCEELGVDFGVHTGKEPLKEQFNLFSKADLVIGPHGAGMANILFCQPGTSVRLFPMFPKVDDSFHYLSAALDLDYEEITTIQSTTKGNYGILNESKLNDVLESIETVVRQRNDKGADCQN